MTAQEVIETMYAARYTGQKVGLQNTQALLDALHVRMTMPTVHVAGTNGKGSVCAMLESILRCSGRKTGLYTSPFLQNYNERIRIDGEPVSDDMIAHYGTRVLDAAKKLHDSGIIPTTFELGTALAFLIFQEERVDAAVIEVGLGGRIDPTNVLTPTVSVITAIGMDHMQYLGDTLTAIAGEKAGIIKAGVPVVASPAAIDVAEVFRSTAAEKHAPLTQLRGAQIEHAVTGMTSSAADFALARTWKQVRIGLAGEYQLTNALTALGAVEALTACGADIPEQAVYDGVAQVRWPARLEWCGQVLLDGAHNAQGVAALQTYVGKHLADRRRVLLTGVLEEKLHAEMLHGLTKLADGIVTVTPDSPRAMQGEELARRLHACGASVQAAGTLEEGLRLARTLAGADGVVIAAGSLYLAGELRTLLGLPWR